MRYPKSILESLDAIDQLNFFPQTCISILFVGYVLMQGRYCSIL